MVQETSVLTVSFAVHNPLLLPNAVQVLLFHIWVLSHRLNAFRVQTENTAIRFRCKIQLVNVLQVIIALLEAPLPHKSYVIKTLIAPRAP